jgi:hypothetical protein
MARSAAPWRPTVSLPTGYESHCGFTPIAANTLDHRSASARM